MRRIVAFATSLGMEGRYLLHADGAIAPTYIIRQEG